MSNFVFIHLYPKTLVTDKNNYRQQWLSYNVLLVKLLVLQLSEHKNLCTLMETKAQYTNHNSQFVRSCFFLGNEKLFLLFTEQQNHISSDWCNKVTKQCNARQNKKISRKGINYHLRALDWRNVGYVIVLWLCFYLF